MAEQVDASDLKSDVSNDVPIRIWPKPPLPIIQSIQKEFPNVTNHCSRSALASRNRISHLVLGTNSEQSHQMVLCPGDAFRSSGNPRILVLRSSSDSLTEMAVGKDRLPARKNVGFFPKVS